MIGVSVRDDNDVNVLCGLYPAAAKPIRGLARRKALAQLFIFARKRAVASIEQHQLLAGIHKRRNVGMLEPLGIDIVRACKSLHLISRCVRTIVRM